MRERCLGVFLTLAVGGCSAVHPGHRLVSDDPGADDAGDAPDADVTPDVTPDGSAPGGPDLGGADLAASALAVGGYARVTADWLNLRSGPGTTNAVLTEMPCGARVPVIGGPSSGWWNVQFSGQTGWASGKYLVADAAFDSSVCVVADMGSPPPPADGGMAGEVADIFTRAKYGVGYSYYWGHGSWRTDGQQIGSCTGSCPSCSHSGTYGADCSGYVAKVWQIPSPSALTQDLHPYSTYNFYNQTTHWSKVARSSIQPADALTYNANGSGHIALFESGSDPWGSLWLYEARGCATGVTHNLRTVSSSYITIRREGL